MIVQPNAIRVPYRVRVGYDADILATQLLPCGNATMTSPNTALPSTSTATSLPATFQTSDFPRIEVRNGYEYVYVPFRNAGGTTSAAFWIMRYEVSNDEFAAYLGTRSQNRSDEGNTLYRDGLSGSRIFQTAGVWRVEPGYSDHPVVRVSWYGARDFCADNAARLPTAEEWQNAAGWNPSTNQMSAFAWGNDPPNDQLANFASNDTLPINSFPNGQTVFGAYNMSGNAAEWVAAQIETSINRTHYGGGWDSSVAQLRISVNRVSIGSDTSANVGFRCASDD